MDTDGDHLAKIKDKRILGAIPEQTGIKFDKGLKGKKVIASKQELLQHFRRSCEPSQIGQITIYNVVWNDLMKNGKGNYSKKIYALGFLQGWDIDKAKTGAVVNIPKQFRIKNKPHWLYLNQVYNSDRQKFIENKGIVKNFPEGVYHSNAPMGKLCDYVLERASHMMRHHSQTMDFSGALATKVNVDEVVAVFDVVKDIEKAYRNELVEVIQKFGVKTKENTAKIKIAMNDITEKYHNLLCSLPVDNLATAVACYKVCYGRETHNSNSKSFVWNCMFDEILEVIQRLNNGRKLVKLPSTIEEDVDTVYVNSRNVLFAGNKSYRNVNVREGEYCVEVINGERFIFTNRNESVQIYNETIIEDENKVYCISIGGYAKQGLTGIEVYDLLKKNNFTIKFVDDIARIIVDGKIISGILNKSVLDIVKLTSKELKIESIQNPIFEPKRVDKNTVWFNKDKNQAVRKSLDITFKVVGDMEDTEDNYYTKKENLSIEGFITNEEVAIDNLSKEQPKYTTEELFSVKRGIENPFGCEYDLNVVQTPYKELTNGSLVGTVVLYKGDKSYLYELLKFENSLMVQSSVKVTDKCTEWLRSLVATEYVKKMY